MKFLVSIYQDEDGVYIAECRPGVPGRMHRSRYAIAVTMREVEVAV